MARCSATAASQQGLAKVEQAPQKRAYETVLRDGLAMDACDPLGIYFGTRSGQLFGSYDEGKTWQKILEGLPAVVCVRTALVENSAGSAVGKPRPAQPAPKSRPATKSRSASKSQRTKR